MTRARNDLGAPVPKFCLGLEVGRRTTEGRVRTAGDFLTHFFPHSDSSAEDRIFRFLPREVRGPMLTAWGVRANKSALRDSDEKVRSVVHDALVAGDLDAATFEETMTAEVVVGWTDLPAWWSFWRGGKLGKHAILKALESGFELGLFDAEWFLQSIASKDGKLRGTDVLCDGLSKADLTEWLRVLYQRSDGTPKGIVASLGWDQIVAKTADDVLVLVLDAMAGKVGLRNEGDVGATGANDANANGHAGAPPVDGPPVPRSEELTGEAAARLFKNDELIPILSGEDDEPEEATELFVRPSQARVPSGSKKADERPSKIPRAR